jgi:hypothetical protein
VNNIFDIAGMVSPVADSIGIGQVWRNMVVERTAQSCAVAALQASGKGHGDLMALADCCFDHCEAESRLTTATANIRTAFIDARNIVARMQHRENSDEA